MKTLNETQKKAAIKKLAKQIIKESNAQMVIKLEKALNSGCLDIENWDPNINPMILPKTIFTAILESESLQYNGQGTSHEKNIKKEVRNIRYFI